MSGASSSLPDLHQLDSDALRALILTQHEQLTAQEEEIFLRREQLAWRDAEIEQLKLLIAKLRPMQFGRKRQIRSLAVAAGRLSRCATDRARSTSHHENGAAVATGARRKIARF